MKPLERVKQTIPEEKKKKVIYQVPCKDFKVLEVLVLKWWDKENSEDKSGQAQTSCKKGTKREIVVNAYTTNYSIKWEREWVNRTADIFWKKRPLEALQISSKHIMKFDCIPLLTGMLIYP